MPADGIGGFVAKGLSYISLALNTFALLATN